MQNSITLFTEDQMNGVTAFVMHNIVLSTITDTIPEVTHTAQVIIAAFIHQSGLAGQSTYKWSENNDRLESV